MDVHTPKHLPRTVKEFLGEIGIIVIGVLIALSAEQIADALRWRQETQAGAAALKVDFRRVLTDSAERQAAAGCIDRRLDDVARALDAGATSGALPPLGAIHYPPSHLWHSNSWDSLVASQAATHFSRERLLQYSELAYYLNAVAAEGDEEYRLWSRLTVVVGPGRRLGEAEAADLRQTLAQARGLAFELDISATEVTDKVQATGLFSKAEVASAQKAFDLAALPVCRPVGPAPAAYGLATR